MLDDEPVSSITPELRPGDGRDGVFEPQRLAYGLYAFEGSHYAKAQALFLKPESPWFDDLRVASSPYLRRVVGADDLAQQGLKDERWIVDTLDATLDEIHATSPETFEFLTSHVRPVRSDELLKPYKGLSARWWQLWNPRAGDYAVARAQPTVLAIPIVTKYVFAWRLPSEWTFLNSTIVVRDSSGFLGVLNSFLFDVWVRRFSGRREDRVNVGLSTAVRTFPGPRRTSGRGLHRN